MNFSVMFVGELPLHSGPAACRPGFVLTVRRLEYLSQIELDRLQAVLRFHVDQFRVAVFARHHVLERQIAMHQRQELRREFRQRSPCSAGLGPSIVPGWDGAYTVDGRHRRRSGKDGSAACWQSASILESILLSKWRDSQSPVPSEIGDPETLQVPSLSWSNIWVRAGPRISVGAQSASGKMVGPDIPCRRNIRGNCFPRSAARAPGPDRSGQSAPGCGIDRAGGNSPGGQILRLGDALAHEPASAIIQQQGFRERAAFRGTQDLRLPGVRALFPARRCRHCARSPGKGPGPRRWHAACDH